MIETVTPKLLAHLTLDDLKSNAERLVLDTIADKWGAVSPSIYDTAMVARFQGMPRRVDSFRFILGMQRPDGLWGGPGSYAIVPTLAATAALWAVVAQAKEGDNVPVALSAVYAALTHCRSALPALFACTPSLPDTVAVELAIPALIEVIGDLCNTLRYGQDKWADLAEIYPALLRQLPGANDPSVTYLRAAANAGQPLPVHNDHILECLGPALPALGLDPESRDTFGGSPAATAAVRALRARPATVITGYLAEVADRLGGTYPTILPITTFERGWIAYDLLRSPGLRQSTTQSLAAALVTILGPQGAPGGHGLPPDLDDTAIVLGVAAQLGSPLPCDPLFAFDGPNGFFCYHTGERTPSFAALAHALEALRFSLPPVNHPERVEPAIRGLKTRLHENQSHEGRWLDKWHASPYYGTLCILQALSREYDAESRHACTRSWQWVVESQDLSGGWGIFGPTLEETAYAINSLLCIETSHRTAQVISALQRGLTFLSDCWYAPEDSSVRQPLWHGKDLYTPYRVVQAQLIRALSAGAMALGAMK